ncbi:hypothetical protein GA8_16885 [Geobacillus sp. A8]|nr:hypothetical protein GA8_16885 [Geobacillus sp. A8]
MSATPFHVHWRYGMKRLATRRRINKPALHLAGQKAAAAVLV